MAWFDCAEHRPLGPQTEPLLVKKNKIIIHTMVGTLAGTDRYFRDGFYDGTESHFGVGGYGEKWQWQETERQADAQLQGNDDCISIENADMGAPFLAWSGSNVPAFTAAQVEANAQILAEAHRRHNIPLVLIPDTQDATRGVGYHRQGIDPWRKHGELYSTSYGKVCPGDRRIAQVPQVIRRAIEITQQTQEDGRGPHMIIGQDQGTGKIWLIAGNTKIEMPGGSTGPYVTEWLRQLQQAYPSGPAPRLVALNPDIVKRIPTIGTLDDATIGLLTEVKTELDAVKAKVDGLDAPTVDAQAVADALAANSTFLDAIATTVVNLLTSRLQS